MSKRSTRWLPSTTCIIVALTVRLTFAGQIGLGDDPWQFDRLIETAWQNRDLAFLDANLTGDAHYSIHGTAEHSKAEWLESVGRSSGAARTLVAVQIRRQPNAVVTTGHIRVASSPSSNAELQIYFVRRYVPESGSWKLALHRTIREERGAPPVHRSLSTGGFAFDAQALRQRNGVSAPRLLRHVAPQYSADGMRAGIEGKVRLEFVVKPDGSVGDVRILRSLDAIFGLDEAAIVALKQCRFEPGTKDGVAVPVIATMESAFVLR
jgi:TonB family protein